MGSQYNKRKPTPFCFRGSSCFFCLSVLLDRRRLSLYATAGNYRFVPRISTDAPASRNRLAALSSWFQPPCPLPSWLHCRPDWFRVADIHPEPNA